MSLFLIVFLFALWSTSFPLGKSLVGLAPPVFLTGYRMLFGALLLLGYLFVKKRLTLQLTKKQWFSLLLLGLFSIYLTNILEFWGLKYLPAAKVCFIYSLSPFLTALFSYIHFKEKMTLRKWLGMSIGFLGFIPVLLSKSSLESIVHAFSVFSWAEIAIATAATFAVYGWVILRIVVKDEELSPVAANGWSMLIGGALALTTSFFVDTWRPTPILASNALPFFQGVFAMTLISNVICFNLYGYLLKRYTATLLSFFGLLSPVFASISSWMFLGEEISWTIILSTGIVALGLWIVYKEELQQGYIKQPTQSEQKSK